MPNTPPKQDFILDADDLGFLLPGLDDVLRLKQHYKNFKITLFIIPFAKEYFLPKNRNLVTVSKYRKWAEIVNSYSDWMEIGIHGFGHELGEFDCKAQRAEKLLDAAENTLKEIGLSYQKIFRAPYWQYSYDSLNVLKDRGYVVCIDRNNPITVPKGTKTYIYNWSFNEPVLPPGERVRGHGHMWNTGRVANSFSQTYENMTKLIPAGANFKFISEELHLK